MSLGEGRREMRCGGWVSSGKGDSFRGGGLMTWLLLLQMQSVESREWIF